MTMETTAGHSCDLLPPNEHCDCWAQRRLVVVRGRRQNRWRLLLALDEAAHVTGVHVDVKAAATGAGAAARHTGRGWRVVIMIMRRTMMRMGMRLLMMIRFVLMRHG